MNRAKDNFYRSLGIAFWLGFGYSFGWAGYVMQNTDKGIGTAYLEGLPRGLLFFFILAFLHAIVYVVVSLWESKDED